MIPEKTIPAVQGMADLQLEETVKEIYDCYELYDLRQCLWEWFKAGLNDDTIYDTPDSRRSLVDLYEKMDTLVLASHNEFIQTRAKRGPIG